MRSHVSRPAVLGIAGAAIALAVAPVSTAQRHGAASSTVTSVRKASVISVTAGRPSENKFLLSRTSVQRGTVIFKITNLGRRPHTFGVNGHTSKKLRPHESTTLTVVFKKAARYVYSDTCIENPNVAEQQEGATPPPCAGGILKVI
jgi:hypothetical protein